MAGTKSTPASTGCIAVAAVLGLLTLVGMCTPAKDKTTQSFVSPSLSDQIEAMPSPAPAPIAALDRASGAS